MKKNILLLIETSREFGRGLIRGISSYATEKGSWNIYLEERGLTEDIPDWVLKWKGDGIISRTSSTIVANALAGLHIPRVELLGDGGNCSAELRTDEQLTAELAVDHFFKLGLKHYGFVGMGNTWWTKLRMNYFKMEVYKRNGVPHVFFRKERDSSYFYPQRQIGFNKEIHRWLREIPRPIGIWATGDSLAIFILNECRNLEIDVPEEIAILGTTNDSLLCNVVTPQLSSIDLDSPRLGYEAAKLLDDKINKRIITNIPRLVPPLELVCRQSTDQIMLYDSETRQALKYIRENATSGISVDDVVHQTELSRSTLQRRFQLLLHKSIDKEIMRIRMDYARRLLRDTDFALSAIAIKVGFKTTEYFVQAFRREVGITPTQYRRSIIR